MSSICSSRFPIPCACRAIALSLVALALGGPAAAQRDEGVVDELARLLAAADTRVYDTALFREALRHPDPFVRRQAALAAGRIGDPQAVDPLVAALGDSGPTVQAAAAFALGLLKSPRAIAPLLALAHAVPAERQGPPQSEAVTAIAKTGGDEAAAALSDLLGSGAASTAVQRAALLETWRLGARAPIPTLMREARNPDPVARGNAIYALARLHDSTLAALALPLTADPDVNVVVQAETTLGVLGGARAVAALQAGLASRTFALRRQAAIALAQADSAAGVAAAAALLAGEADWRWRSVAAETFGAARDRGRLEAQLADVDGRVAVQALQALQRLVPDGDSSLSPRARTLLLHPDAAVRSVAADLLARHAVV